LNYTGCSYFFRKLKQTRWRWCIIHKLHSQNWQRRVC